MTPTFVLRRGDALEQLRLLPSDSVDCVVTSPPYYGLRAYDTDPQVWGGRPECAHEWHAGPRIHKGGPHGPGVLASGGRAVVEAQAKVKTIETGAFCSRCDAWRGELGHEPTPELYVEHVVAIFREVRRVLRPEGTLWLNLGDSYAASGKGGGGAYTRERRAWSDAPERKGWRSPPDGLKSKDLIGIPWRVALALQADGWCLRSEVIWHKPNVMPESVTDRPTRAHEHLFLLSKRTDYYYDFYAVLEEAVGGASGNREREADHRPHGDRARGVPWAGSKKRNRRTVWSISTRPYKGAHFATFPPTLVEPCVLAGSSEMGVCSACRSPWTRVVLRDPVRSAGWAPGCECDADPVPAMVLDPFAGSGTTGAVALQHGRNFIGIDLNPTYLDTLALPRLQGAHRR